MRYFIFPLIYNSKQTSFNVAMYINDYLSIHLLLEYGNGTSRTSKVNIYYFFVNYLFVTFEPFLFKCENLEEGGCDMVVCRYRND